MRTYRRVVICFFRKEVRLTLPICDHEHRDRRQSCEQVALGERARGLFGHRSKRASHVGPRPLQERVRPSIRAHHELAVLVAVGALPQHLRHVPLGVRVALVHRRALHGLLVLLVVGVVQTLLERQNAVEVVIARSHSLLRRSYTAAVARISAMIALQCNHGTIAENDAPATKKAPKKRNTLRKCVQRTVSSLFIRR